LSISELFLYCCCFSGHSFPVLSALSSLSGLSISINLMFWYYHSFKAMKIIYAIKISELQRHRDFTMRHTMFRCKLDTSLDYRLSFEIDVKNKHIFRHYGYSYDNKKCKKPHSLIITNLISPKIDYQSYGKSRIDFRPFAEVVAKTTVLACMGGAGRTSDGKPSKRAVLLEVLEKRKQKWEAMDAVSRPKHWWTQ